MPERAVERLLDKLEKVSESGSFQWVARCPAHADGRPSLSIREAEDGTVLIHCFAGCDKPAILNAVGLTWASLFPKGISYNYEGRDHDGGIVTIKTVKRTYDGNEKRFRQSGDTKAHLLYGLVRLEQAVAIGERIHVVEGEKDVAAARLIGLEATTVDGGAGGAAGADWSALYGADVVVCGDQDKAGEKYVAAVVAALQGKAKSLRIARPAKGFKDLADHVAAGRDANDIRVKRRNLSAPGAAPAANPEAESETGDSWRPRDVAAALRDVLAGNVERPSPTIGRIEGLLTALFYLGRVNGIHGESGIGKSWLLWLVFAQEIAAGRHVLLIDYEDSIDAALLRLLDLGADTEAIERYFHYVQPEERSAVGIDRIEALVDEYHVILVGVDSVGEGLSLDGVQPNADEEVAAWFREVPRRLARRGPAVAVLDHSPKATGDGELFPIGSQRKRSAINGAQYLLRGGIPFSQGKPGHSTLICAKDRGGLYAKGSRVARLSLTVAGDFTLTAEQAPTAQDFRPTTLMDKVSRFIEDQDAPPSRNAIEKGVSGKKDNIGKALKCLIDEGFLRADEGARNATLHTSLKPYRQSNDPKSDLYDPQSAPVTLPLETPTTKSNKKER